MMLAVFAIFFFASDILHNIIYKKILRSKDSSALSAQIVDREETEKYFYVNKDSNLKGGPNISAAAYLVGDLNTGEVILAKNQDEKFPLASVSKLMTALVTKEISKEDALAEVSKGALETPGKNGGLRIGEKIKILDLLYPLLLESSNDAAEIIAGHFERDTFLKKMNQEAENLKMSLTTYEDPSGLSPNNQSTVSDMFKLVGYINKKNPELLEITTKRSFSNKKHSWSNISQFLRKEGYLGGKSGYTDEARQTGISLFSLPLGDQNKNTGNRPIAITLLQSKDRYRDVENILKYLKKYIYYGGNLDANTDWVAEKVGAPDIREPDFVTFTFLGDMMLDRGVKNSVLKNFNNDYSALFEKMELLKDSDIVFANLEGTASDQGADLRNLYSFQMDPAVVPALAGAGIDVLSVANNHVGDWGRMSFVDTLENLKENEIRYTGGGENSVEAEMPTILEKYGIKIGFLGFSDVGPNWMKATEEQAGLLLASNPRFEEIIQDASRQVDFLVVSFHFGEEYQTKHNARQELLARKAVDSGAKIVVGHHPHVVEDTEIYSRKDCTQSSCMGYIAYSLGNFIFDQSFSAETMQGMLLNLKLNKDGNMTIKKDAIKLNKAFQPDTVIMGKKEQIEFKK